MSVAKERRRFSRARGGKFRATVSCCIYARLATHFISIKVVNVCANARVLQYIYRIIQMARVVEVDTRR